eukprot:365371-Chlamydomonas_euryale.AAC.1
MQRCAVGHQHPAVVPPPPHTSTVPEAPAAELARPSLQPKRHSDQNLVPTKTSLRPKPPTGSVQNR